MSLRGFMGGLFGRAVEPESDIREGGLKLAAAEVLFK